VSAFWHMFKVLRGAVIFTGFYLSGGLYGWLVLPLISLTVRDPVARIRRNQVVVSNAFRATLHVLRWSRIFTFDPRKVEPRLPDRPVIIVANHPTTIDVVSVLSIYREASVVVKRKIWTDPLLRRLFRFCGHIDGGDGSMESNVTLLAQVKERLAQGFNVVIFPEGTRSPVHGLGTMFKGAFAVASTTHTDVLPVVIRCEPPALHKEAPWHVLPAHPVRYEVTPGELVRVGDASAKKLQRTIVQHYEQELGATVHHDPSAPEPFSGDA
jgi:1-acyl-sn-glycerol-3-phosphate acyltransferase